MIHVLKEWQKAHGLTWIRKNSLNSFLTHSYPVVKDIVHFKKYKLSVWKFTFRKMVQMINSAMVHRGEKLLPAGMIKKGRTFQIYLRIDPKTTQIKASL